MLTKAYWIELRGKRMDGEYIVETIRIDFLKTHEEIKSKKVVKLFEMTKKWGAQRKPVVIDSSTGVILDGHHRHAVAVQLNLEKIAVIKVDYFDDEKIKLESRNQNIPFSSSKSEVINMGLSEQNFPAKTTKHIFDFEVPDIWINLEDLI